MLVLQAIHQTAEPARANLTGILLFILMLGVILSVPVSMGLIWLYRRAVLKSMRAGARPLTGEAPPPLNITSPEQSRQKSPELAIVDRASSSPTTAAAKDLYAQTLRGPWRVASIYVVAGLCYSLIMTVVSMVADDIEFLPLRFFVYFWINAWPIVLTVNLIANASWRTKLATVVLYFLSIPILTVIVATDPITMIWYALVAWFWLNSLPTFLLLAFLNRRVRAVGPLVLIFLIVALAGPQVVVSIAASNDSFLYLLTAAGKPLGLSAEALLLVLLLFGFIGATPIAWLTLKWIGSRYKRKKISDQSITLDTLWLLFGFFQSLMLASAGAGWVLGGFLAFIVYKIITRLGFALIAHKASPTKANAKLLLLRVFSLGKRSERLFDALAKHWRHIGSIQLIAGTDLATDNLEPHEFLDFLTAKLARRFIDAPATLDLRISEMDSRPDQDGRFRVNEFFSHDDTWRHVLSRLVSESDAVLMDLRGFTPQNAGCVYEIAELINVMPLARVQFLVDKTTNEPFLQHCMRESWNSMRPTSPNRSNAPAELGLFRFRGSRRGELRRLLRSLCTAAKAV
ncbi:MAG TPA: hypothetical protein VGJ66_17375 [Pyrinomonadaceae bacterium]